MPPRLRKASEKAEALSLNDMVLSGSDEEEAQDEQHELESKTRARSVPSRQVKKAKPAEKGKAQAVVKAKGAKRRASSPPPEQPAKKKKVSKGKSALLEPPTKKKQPGQSTLLSLWGQEGA